MIPANCQEGLHVGYSQLAWTTWSIGHKQWSSQEPKWSHCKRWYQLIIIILHSSFFSVYLVSSLILHLKTTARCYCCSLWWPCSKRKIARICCVRRKGYHLKLWKMCRPMISRVKPLVGDFASPWWLSLRCTPSIMIESVFSVSFVMMRWNAFCLYFHHIKVTCFYVQLFRMHG